MKAGFQYVPTHWNPAFTHPDPSLPEPSSPLAQNRLAQTGSQDEDDLAQEVCLALLSALPSYQDMGRPFGAFAFAIAAHKVADAARGGCSCCAWWRAFPRRYRVRARHVPGRRPGSPAPGADPAPRTRCP